MPVFGNVFTEGWRSLLGWTLGLAAAASLDLPFFPTIGGSPQIQDVIDSLPQELTRSLNYDQIGTGPGYAQATLFGLIAFLLLSIAAISWGASALGGDEESGQLELTLAHAVTRVQVALARYAAMAVKIMALSALTCVLVLLSGSVALLCGALTGRRIWGIGGGTAVAVVGYVFNAIGNQSANVEWLHAFSPYYWAIVIMFFAVSFVLAAATAVAWRQRDVGV
ncbi:ABC transporter permease subunit [Cryobacterium psychrophilum]|uniref:ABC transporter permease n=1 Tax=Cryobacterium psychrophilum TaxID=41988 RepID=A0A4Y8KM04_9MICO|nr:ABC transporter permease subunit [Cryobacterium psychrophilum]TFD75740.1 ABC transporter permease [Cryobacterium psychrophilum]